MLSRRDYTMRKSCALSVVFSLFVMITGVYAQERDVRGERLVLDNNGTDSTLHTITIRTPSTLPHNLVLTIPDPETGTAEFMLASPGSSGSGFWLAAGNNGTVSGTDVLGTKDSSAMQIQVRGASGTIVNSLILNENGSLQRDTGGNARGANAVDLQIARSAATEVAVSNYSIIAGGESNGMENTNGTYTTIRGGADNVMLANQSRYAVIGGGWSGTISGSQNAMIGGGGNNTIDPEALYATIRGGGANHIDSAYYALIGGGGSNTLDYYSARGTISGGGANDMGLSSVSAIMGGGANYVYWASDGIVGGGYRNRIQFDSQRGTIGGGSGNIIDLGCQSATIRGGAFIWIRRRTYFPSDSYATVGGGGGHTVGQGSGTSDATDATVGGGVGHIIGVDGAYSTIGGGAYLNVAKVNSVIPGGRELDLNGVGSFGFLANGGSNDMVVSESEVVVFGNTNLWLANNNNRPSQLRLYEPHDTSGAFPGSAYYTSFGAPALADTIRYILPASKPSETDQVLAVSTINDDTITLAWQPDGTVVTHRDSDVPTAIAVPNDNSRKETRMAELETQYEAQERQFEVQEKELNALLTRVRALKKQESDL